MFEKLIRELKALETQSQVSVPIEADADGYLDKECPAENCLFGFKVHEEDWKNIITDEAVHCPSCGHVAPSRSWWPREQLERAKQHAIGQLQGRINQAMRDDARSWNSRQSRNSFLKITMEVRGGTSPVLLPVSAAEPMRLRAQCDSCGCRYSYIGAAFFCPACGRNSARHTFHQTLSGIRTSVESDAILRGSMGRDEAEVVIRVLLEKGMQDAVTCFQRLNEQLAAAIPDTPAPRRNLFQSLDDGSRYWQATSGLTFDTLLDAEKMSRLRRYFQQRHLLAHQQGVVDADYITRSGDQTFAVGQRLTLSKTQVLDMVALVEELGGAILHKQ